MSVGPATATAAADRKRERDVDRVRYVLGSARVAGEGGLGAGGCENGAAYVARGDRGHGDWLCRRQGADQGACGGAVGCGGGGGAGQHASGTGVVRVSGGLVPAKGCSCDGTTHTCAPAVCAMCNGAGGSPGGLGLPGRPG